MSHPKWPLVPLGELITKSEERVMVEADQDYPNFGIYNRGRGLFEKPSISGATSSATSLYRARANQFVYSRLFAFEGAYGWVPNRFDGYFVSNEFPLFECDGAKLLPEFLGWYFRNPATWTDLANLTTGMGSRRQRLKPEEFLRHGIRLPSLATQARIVDDLSRMASKITESQECRLIADRDLSLVPVAMTHRLDLTNAEKASRGWELTTFGELMSLSLNDEPVIPGKEYPNVGIYSYGKGLFEKTPISGMSTSAAKLRRLEKDQFVYSQLFAWEGAFALVSERYSGSYVSSEYPTFRANLDRILPEYIIAYFSSDRVWRMVAEESKGLGSRRQRVHPSQLLNLRAMVPPMSVQRSVKATIKANERSEMDRALVKSELDAMMPSILDRAFKGDL